MQSYLFVFVWLIIQVCVRLCLFLMASPDSRDFCSPWLLYSDSKSGVPFFHIGFHISRVTHLVSEPPLLSLFLTVPVVLQKAGQKGDQVQCWSPAAWDPSVGHCGCLGEDGGAHSLQDFSLQVSGLTSFHRCSLSQECQFCAGPCSPPNLKPPLPPIPGIKPWQWLFLRRLFDRFKIYFTVSFLDYISFESFFSFLFFGPLSVPNSGGSFV